MHKKHDTHRATHKVKRKDDHLPAAVEKSVADKSGQKVIKEEKVEKEDATWDCPTCTFKNLEIIPYCEMCGLKKNTKAPPQFKAKDLPEVRVVNQEKDRQVEEKVKEVERISEAASDITEKLRAISVEGWNSRYSFELSPRSEKASKPVESAVIHRSVSSKNPIGSDRGNLKVTLIAAVGLLHKASYALITLGRLTKKTKPVKKSKTLELDQVFFFNGFKPDSSRNLRVALMKEHKVRADKVIGQVSYALPLTFNSLSHDCVELTDEKNNSAGLLIISAVILQHGDKY